MNSYISFETSVEYGFLESLSTIFLLFKECKYFSPKKLTFLVQNMTLQNDFFDFKRKAIKKSIKKCHK
jgi:hypothetical protein